MEEGNLSPLRIQLAEWEQKFSTAEELNRARISMLETDLERAARDAASKTADVETLQ